MKATREKSYTTILKEIRKAKTLSTIRKAGRMLIHFNGTYKRLSVLLETYNNKNWKLYSKSKRKK